MKVLIAENSIVSHFVAELRSVELQKDSWRFRKNLERIGEVLAYEISKSLEYSFHTITTPLGKTTVAQVNTQPVLAVVLRAGLPLYQGFLHFFDRAESVFIAAYRSPPDKNHSFEVKMDYLSGPSIEKKNLILIDPMLATGKSLLKSYEAILQYGKPDKVFIASVIASKAGVEYVQQNLPEAAIFTAALDDQLNHKYYIVPGLGDAGDLAFGSKI